MVHSYNYTKAQRQNNQDLQHTICPSDPFSIHCMEIYGQSAGMASSEA